MIFIIIVILLIIIVIIITFNVIIIIIVFIAIIITVIIILIIILITNPILLSLLRSLAIPISLSFHCSSFLVNIYVSFATPITNQLSQTTIITIIPAIIPSKKKWDPYDVALSLPRPFLRPS